MRNQIYLLRHAQSAPSPHAAGGDWPLSAEGYTQAQRLADYLQRFGIDIVVSSPLRRAVESVEPFAHISDLEVQICPDLREAEGVKIWVEDFRAHVRRLWDEFDLKLQGLESHRECQARVLRAVTKLASSQPGKTLLCCSHGQAIGLFLHYVDPAFTYDDWAEMKMPDIRRVAWDGDLFRYDRTFSIDPGIVSR